MLAYLSCLVHSNPVILIFDGEKSFIIGDELYKKHSFYKTNEDLQRIKDEI